MSRTGTAFRVSPIPALVCPITVLHCEAAVASATVIDAFKTPLATSDLPLLVDLGRLYPQAGAGRASHVSKDHTG
jgi:hypothetical protein